MKTKLKVSLIALSAMGLMAGSSVMAFAAGSGTDVSIQQPQGFGVTSLPTLINAAFKTALFLAIVVVFAMLIVGGYGWITAGGDKAKVEEARTRITNAVIGLAIIAAAWVIIQLLGNFFGVSITNINIPSAADGTTTGQPS